MEKEDIMINIQIIGDGDIKPQTLIRNAITEGRIRAFSIVKVKGGLKITHKNKTYPGSINLTQTPGPLVATVMCKNKDKEWQLLKAFIGVLAYNFRSDIAAINIQFNQL